jgi:CheY-like chemotaxis protein
MEEHGVPLRVLVIASSAYSSEMLREVGALGGFSVEMMRDPREALQQLKGELFDVVVIDLPNPEMTAADLYLGVLEANSEQAGRVVFLADDLSDPVTRKFLAQAERPFLTQPFDAGQLYDLVMRAGFGEENEA